MFSSCLHVSVSQGGTGNLSHLTPNTSLGFVQATPSRVLPSPTVNTREALGEHRCLWAPPGGSAVVEAPERRVRRLCFTSCSHFSFPDVIMDMFQAPTLLEDPFTDGLVLHAAEREAERTRTEPGESVANRPSANKG